jgi:CDP-glycerol glycerophosphotransferase (TagB/SpsB family)
MTFLAAARVFLTRLGFAVGRLRPVRRRVVLATANGSRLSGNLAWIERAVRRDLPSVELVVLAHRQEAGIVGRLETALQGVRAGYHLATAALFVVDDYFFPMYVVPRRRGTRFVQVWHACGAFKKFGYSAMDKRFGGSAEYIQAVRIHSTYDLCLVSAARFIAPYMEAFGLPADRFTADLGIPRTDLFFDVPGGDRIRAELRRRYGIPDGRQVVLYAPTFRGELVTVARDPMSVDFAELATAIGDSHVILYRSHPLVRDHARLAADHPGFVIDVSSHPDMNELMLVSDVLITDYSSAIYEFALLGRPMAFFAPDHEEYEHERGFYFDYATGLPGPVFTATAEVAGWLREGAYDLDRVRRFAAESFDVADGRSTERFLEQVVRPATVA